MKTISELKERIKIDERSGCWLWIGSKDSNGYGRIGNGTRGKSEYAHRVFFEHYHGPIAKGLSVCHVCDVPHCVNPRHLWLGTQADNIKDMARKGRGHKTGARGSQNGRSKLSETDIPQIFKARAIGLSQERIAEQFGIDQTSISDILNRKKWGHVAIS